MRWTVHSEKPLYTDQWLDIRVADVEIPGGRHLQHRLIRTGPGAGAVVMNNADEVLLEWRHRFIPDTWGYAIPIGAIHPDETPHAAAAREVEEETGWRPAPLRPLIYVQPTPGISDSEHHIYFADTAHHIGEPAETWESEHIEWVPLADIPTPITQRKLVSGTSTTALLYLHTTSRPTWNLKCFRAEQEEPASWEFWGIFTSPAHKDPYSPATGTPNQSSQTLTVTTESEPEPISPQTPS